MNAKRRFDRQPSLLIALSLALLATPGAVAAQQAPATATPTPTPTQTRGEQLEGVGRDAGRIASQPARDVGAVKREIPPVLVSASEDPYSLQGLRTCTQLATAVRNLNEALGEDFKTGTEKKENRAGRLAAAGGRTIVNTIIPFRGLVREISGAAPAERRYNAAVDAGYARRGFLRGVHETRRCRTTF